MNMESDKDYKKVLAITDNKNNIVWLKKNSDVKPIDLLNKYLKPNEILFKCVNRFSHNGKQLEGHLFAKTTYNHYKQLLNKNRYIYEIIPAERPRKCYFDIDGENENCLEKAIEIIKMLFGDDVKMAISGKGKGTYKNKNKWSYHIILYEIIFKDKDAMKLLKDCLTSLKNKENGIDNLIYGSNQAFKTINQAKDRKDKKRIQKIIKDDNIENHIVNVIGESKSNGEQFNDEFKKHIKIENKKLKKKLVKRGVKNVKIKNFNNFKQIQFLNVPAPHIDFDFDDPLDILLAIPNEKPIHKLGKKNHFNIGNWAFHNDINYQEYQMWEKRHYNAKNETYTNYSDWLSFKEMKYWWGTYKIKNLLECFYGYIPNPRFETFKKQFITNKMLGSTILNDKYFNKNLINNKKFQVLLLEMGRGKTYAVIEYLIQQQKICDENGVKLRVCWITNRISMALNLMGRLNLGNDEKLDRQDDKGRNLNFVNYKDYDGNDLRKCEKVVIELESLFRIATTTNKNSGRVLRKGAEYDILIVDEIESVFNSFSSDTTHQNGLTYDANYLCFERLLKSSTQTFLMDAYIHKRTIKYIKILDIENKQAKTKQGTLIGNGMKDIHIVQANENLIDKRINIHNDFYNWFNTIVDDLTNGKKLYIFYPYKTGKGSSLKISIEGFRDRIIEATRIKWNKKKMKFMEMIEDHNDLEWEYLKQLKIKHLTFIYNWKYNIQKKDFKTYHGDSCDLEKRKLINANKIWKPIKCVITNSSISVGVNYDGKDFDKIYLGYADLISPRDVVQSSMRIRHPKSNVVEFYYFPNVFKHLCEANGEKYIPRPFNKPKLEENTPAFKYMRDFLLEEYNAKGIETLMTFFIATGYKINQEFQNLNGSPNLFRDCRCSKEGVWKYDDIKAIDKKTKNEYEIRLKTSQATMRQKLELDKWFSDNEFKIGVNPNTKKLETLWLNEIRKLFYEKPQIANGFKELWKGNKILRYAMFYYKDKYCLNKKKLTKYQKLEIENFFHLSHFGKVAKSHKEKFMKLSDNNIKKQIIKFFFGRYVLLPIRDIERGKGFWDREKSLDCPIIAENSLYISKALWKKSKKFELNCEIYNKYLSRTSMKKNI